MKLVVIVLLLLIAIGGGWWLTKGQAPQVPIAPKVAVAPQASAPPLAPVDPFAPPPVQYPIEGVVVITEPGQPAAPDSAPTRQAQGPAPTLQDSGEQVERWLGSAAGSLKGVLQVDNFVRRVVATVDNLPRERAAVRLWPVVTVKGLPAVSESDGELILEPANSKRYEPYVALAERVDIDTVVAGYKRLYPVFQEAYRELGYPGGNFNDRIIAVIDDLVAAPEIEGPIPVVQPKVVYRYADPELEALSAGQKMMVRMGADNARRVKARLRQIRQRLAGQV